MLLKFLEQGTGPDLDLLIVDEAQDLVPIQWRMVKECLLPNAKKAYYALMTINVFSIGQAQT